MNREPKITVFIIISVFLLAALFFIFAARTESKETLHESYSKTDTVSTVDVVFFGDSITRGGDFENYFSGVKVVNLGVNGDRLDDLYERVPQVVSYNPRKVFLLGGINSLRDDNIEECSKKYESLLDLLRSSLPQCEIYVQSVLPVSNTVIAPFQLASNKSVISFNKLIKAAAEKRSIEYIDIHSLYYLGGELDASLTSDGLLLIPPAYGRWVEAVRKYVEN